MKIDGNFYRAIWLSEDGWSVRIIDQTQLPHRIAVTALCDLADAAHAIRAMQVRGAPLIGATAAYGLCLAVRKDATDEALKHAVAVLQETRPTAVNLSWALEDMLSTVQLLPPEARMVAAYERAAAICDEDVDICHAIGRHGLSLIEAAARQKRDSVVNVLTHCNAGWIAAVDWGTALSPVYMAHEAGIPLHVWVDETRPRNQGASLTAWELASHGVPHTVIVDNAGGHLMRQGRVDLCITGTDRTALNGDVCNKIGTYLKALAACDNGVPFYVAVPGRSIDWSLASSNEIPIEERSPEEVTHVSGIDEAGRPARVRIVAEGTPVSNPGFDVTPARLVTALITERGVSPASREGLLELFPEKAGALPGMRYES